MTRDYYLAHRAERIAYQKERYARNAVALCAYQRLYRLTHRKEQSEWRREWVNANRDKTRAADRRRYHKQAAMFNAKNKAWRESHPERERARHQVYDRAHPDNVRERAARRRARKVATRVEPIDLMEILRKSRGFCGICKLPLDLFGIHFDHIIPLSKGGTHTADNIQVAHAHCNLVKSAKVG